MTNNELVRCINWLCKADMMVGVKKLMKNEKFIFRDYKLLITTCLESSSSKSFQYILNHYRRKHQLFLKATKDILCSDLREKICRMVDDNVCADYNITNYVSKFQQKFNMLKQVLLANKTNNRIINKASFLAVKTKNIACLDLIYDVIGFDINFNKYNELILIYALKINNVECVEVLLKKKPNVNKQCLFNGVTPLEYVIKNDLVDLANFSTLRSNQNQIENDQIENDQIENNQIENNQVKPEISIIKCDGYQRQQQLTRNI